jgi:hypothetical protein
MARSSENNGNGWDFIEEGKIYQYKEDYLLAMVKVLENRSDDEFFRFLIQAQKCNINMLKPFEVSARKGYTGAYSGMIQFYPEGKEEYVLLPIGTEYKFILSEESNV